MDLYSTGLEEIGQERKEQKMLHTSDRQDDSYVSQELVFAAITYAYPPRARGRLPKKKVKFIVSSRKNGRHVIVPETWPWLGKYYKPRLKNRVKELAKAGALIAAEIDRIKRAERRKGIKFVKAHLRKNNP